MIELSEAMLANILEVSVNMYNDMGNLIVLAIGLPIGFYLVRKVIGLVRFR